MSNVAVSSLFKNYNASTGGKATLTFTSTLRQASGPNTPKPTFQQSGSNPNMKKLALPIVVDEKILEEKKERQQYSQRQRKPTPIDPLVLKYKSWQERQLDPKLEAAYRAAKAAKPKKVKSNGGGSISAEFESDGSAGEDEDYDTQDGFVVADDHISSEESEEDEDGDDEYEIETEGEPVTEGEGEIEEIEEIEVSEDEEAFESEESGEEQPPDQGEAEVDLITDMVFAVEKVWNWPVANVFPEWQLCHVLLHMIEPIYREYLNEEVCFEDPELGHRTYQECVNAAQETFDVLPIKIVADSTIRSFQIWHILFKNPYLSALYNEYRGNVVFKAFFSASEIYQNYRFAETKPDECMFTNEQTTYCVHFYGSLADEAKILDTFHLKHRYRGFVERILFITQFKATVWKSFLLGHQQCYEEFGFTTIPGQKEWLRRHSHIIVYQILRCFVPLFIDYGLMEDWDTPVSKLLKAYCLDRAGV